MSASTPNMVTTITLSLAAAEPEARRRAASHIRGLTPEEARPLLLRALGDDDWRVRREATEAAAWFIDHEPLVAALIDTFRPGDNVGLRNAAVEVLAQLGDGALSAVSDAMSRLDADGRKLAVEVLGASNSTAALAPLQQRLADEDSNVRSAAVEALAGLGRVAPHEVREVLVQCLEAPDVLTRLTALRGLSDLGLSVPWSRLEPLLSDWTLRSAALAAAAQVDDPGAAATTLVEALASAKGGAYQQAVSSVAHLCRGAAAGPLVEALVAVGAKVTDRLLQTASGEHGESASLRADALELAARSDAAGVVTLAVRALEDESLAEHARDSLTVVGAKALPELLRFLQAPTSGALAVDTQATVVDIVTTIAQTPAASAHRDDVVRAIRRITMTADPSAAIGALYALSLLGDAGDLSLVAGLTTSSELTVAHAAERALAALSSEYPKAAGVMRDEAMRGVDRELPAAILVGALAHHAEAPLDGDDASAFLQRAFGSGDAQVRRAAASAVAELGGDAAMDLLGFALADEDEAVQYAAARAVGHLAAIPPGEPRHAGLTIAQALDLVSQADSPNLLATTIRALGDQVCPASDAMPAGDISSALLWSVADELAPHAKSGSPSVAVAAIDTLARMSGAPSTQSALLGALQHPDGSVVRESIQRLDDLGIPRTKLTPALAHSDREVRLLVIEMLYDAEPETAAQALRRRADQESDKEVRFAIDHALAFLKRHESDPAGD